MATGVVIYLNIYTHPVRLVSAAGAHIYTYTYGAPIKRKRVTNVQTPTTHGYMHSDALRNMSVIGIVTGSEEDYGTQSPPEVVAISTVTDISVYDPDTSDINKVVLRCLKKALETVPEDVQSIVVNTPPFEFIAQAMKALPALAKNNFKRDGRTVRGSDTLTLLNDIRIRCVAAGGFYAVNTTEYRTTAILADKKIKRSNYYGDFLSYSVAAVGLRRHNKNLINPAIQSDTGDIVSSISYQSADNYWCKLEDRDPLLIGRFNILANDKGSKKLFISSPGDELAFVGRLMPDGIYAIYETNTLSPILSDVYTHILAKDREVAGHYYGIHLDNLFSEATQHQFSRSNTDCLIEQDALSLSMTLPDKTDIIRDINPTNLTFKASAMFLEMSAVLADYRAGNPKVMITNLLPLVYSKDAKGANKLKTEIDQQTASLRVADAIQRPIDLMFGYDLPPRNNLKRLEGTMTTLDLLLVEQAPGIYATYCYAANANSSCFLTNFYSRFIML